MATVEEVRKRKAATKKFFPEKIVEQEQAERIAAEEAPDPITQDLLDRARRQGINVLSPGNLRRLSEAGQAAEQGRTSAEEALLEGQGKLKEELAIPLEGGDPNLVRGFEGLKEGVGRTARVSGVAGLLKKETDRIIKSTNRKTGNVEAGMKGFVEGLGMFVDVAGSIPLIDIVSFDSIIQTQTQTIADLRGVMSTIRGEVTDRTRTPDEALTIVADLEKRTRRAYEAAHTASNYSFRARLEGMDEVETELLDSLEELNETKGIIMRQIAQQAINPESLRTTEEIIGGLR